MKRGFFTFALLLILCNYAFGQQVLNELTGHKIQVGTCQATMNPGTWYFISNPRLPSENSANHPDWFPGVGEEPVQGGLVYDNVDNVMLSSTEIFATLTYDGAVAESVAKYLVRFIETETNGIYAVQFGTGNFMGSAPGQKTTDKYNAGTFAFYNIETDGELNQGRFGWNVGSRNGARIDNNGAGRDVCTWGSGENHDVIGNNVWLVFDVVDLGIADPLEAAWNELIEVTSIYSEYDFTPGTNPGEYDAEKVAAFQAAMDAAWEADNNDPTAEELRAISQAVRDAYDAVVATQVPYPMTVNPGFYYLISALEYTNQGDEIDPATGEALTTHPTKAMYVDGNKANWANIDREDIRYLWQIVADGHNTYHLISCQADAQFTTVKTSQTVTLSTESDSLVVFDYGGAEGIYNIRLASQKERGFYYLHCNWHGRGTGTGADIVGWENSYEKDTASPGPTEWRLEPVDEDVALALIEAASPTRQIKIMSDSAAVIIAAVPAMIRAAKDEVATIDKETALIKDVAQLSSAMTEPTEGSLYELLDEDTNTYWHSQWSGRAPGNGVDFIQVAEIDCPVVAFMMARRDTWADHVIQMSVYGYDIDDVDTPKEEGELLATLSLPHNTSRDILYSDAFETKGHRVLRFYSDLTTHSADGGRGYWHMSEFQLYPATISNYYADGTTQATQRAAELTALQNAVAAWKTIDTETASLEAITTTFNVLNDAWLAWNKVFVNPAALRDALEHTLATEAIKIGNNPGEWADANAAATVINTINAALAYDKTGLYTPQESAQHLSALANTETDMLAAANSVREDVWYRIRFATEGEYDAAAWDKKPAQEDYIEEANDVASPELFGKTLSAGSYTYDEKEYTDNESNTHTYRVYDIRSLETDDPSLHATIHFMEQKDIKNADMALWRFIAIGDSAYLIQNKGTGLYLRASGTTGQVHLDVQPTLFQQRALGYGTNEIAARNLTDGATENNLHAQRDINILVTWGTTGPGTNTALFIEEAAPVADDDVSNNFTMALWPGQIYTFCYPTTLETQQGNFYSATFSDNTVTLYPVGNSAPAGQPVVYIQGHVNDYVEPVTDPEDPNYNDQLYQLVSFTHGTDFVTQPIASGHLQGTFNSKSIPSGCVWAEKNGFAPTRKISNTVSANTAYIESEIEDLETQITILFSDEDGIAQTLAKVAKPNAIYTIDGRYLGNGNLNTIKSLPKGIYIVNGIKVAIKKSEK